MTAPANARHTPAPFPLADCPILGVSAAIRRAIDLARRFAPTEFPVLLVGPTGSGKELFARQIHLWSGRTGPLVDVNAGALPRDMVESLLFGHRRGAFTGAIQSTEGLMTAAGTGTLFLDELTSLPLEGQAKLLRAVETGEVRPLGETVNRPVRCRFIAAVQEDVDGRITRGEFRGDLYQRMAGAVIRLPALSERREDVLPLARAFAESQGCELSREAEGELTGHRWPGNIRELKATILRASHLVADGRIDGEGVREAIGLGRPVVGGGAPGTVGALAVEALLALCSSHDWDIGRAARAVGVGRSTLYRRLRKLGVDPSLWRIVSPIAAAGRGDR